MDIRINRCNIKELFSNKVYCMNIRERGCVQQTGWSIEQLFGDVYASFEKVEAQDGHAFSQRCPHPAWYFLHTIITYGNGTLRYVVDGRQRLAGLSLILQELHRLAVKQEIAPHLLQQLSELIFAADTNGDKSYRIIDPLLPDILGTSTVRAARRDIGLRLQTSRQLVDFIDYFLTQVIVIDLEIDPAAVQMVFTGCNDRGAPYAQHDLLRSELLAMLPESEQAEYAALWKRAFEPIHDIDQFLRLYLCATVATSRVERVAFDDPYYRVFLADTRLGTPNLGHGDADAVKRFIQGPLRYYTGLYKKLSTFVTGEGFLFLKEGCYYRSVCNGCLTVWDCFTMLVLTTCRVDDPDESLRIQSVARAFDRAYIALMHDRSYDINRFEIFTFSLNRRLRECRADEIDSVFTSCLEQETSHG